MGSSSSKPKVTRYYFDIHMGLGLPLDELVEIRASDKQAWRGSITDNGQIFINAPELFGGDEGEGGLQGRMDVMFGEETQGVLPKLAAMLGGVAPAFRGFTSAFYSGLITTGNPYPKPWEVLRRGGNRLWGQEAPWYPEKQFIWLADGEIKAMNPVHILYQIRTSRLFRGWSRSIMDDAAWRSAADTCYAEGLGLCIEWHRGDTFTAFTDVIEAHVGAEVFNHRTTGLCSIRLLRDDYDPAELPLFDEDSGLLEVLENEAPSVDDMPSAMVVNYIDAIDGEKKTVRGVNAAISARGKRAPKTVDYLGAPTAEIAGRLLERDMRIETGGLRRCKVVLDRRGRDLNLGDPIRIRSLRRGIEQVVVRVGKIEDGLLTNGRITVTVVQDLFGLPSSSFVGVPPAGWQPPDRTPQPVVISQLMEATWRDLVQRVDPANLQLIDVSAAYLGSLASAPSMMSLNYSLTTRVGASGEFINQGIADWCPSGVLAAAIDKLATEITLNSATRLDDVVTGTAALLGDEIVRIDAIDTETGAVTIARGCVDTVPADHDAGTRIWFYEDWTGLDETAYSLGTTMQAQLLTNTSSGRLAPELAGTLTQTLQARQGRPYPPGQFLINGEAYPVETGSELVLSWAHRDRLMQADQLIDTAFGTVGPEPGTTYSARMLLADTATVLDSASGVAGTELTLSTEYQGVDVDIELWSVRDGMESPQRHSHRVALAPPAGVGAHQFWRLYVTENNGATDFYLAIAELKLLDASDTNMAVGGTAAASSTAGAPYLPAAAFDGETSTRFVSQNGTPLPIWLSYEMPAAVELASYSVQVLGAAAWGLRTPKAWVLQYSDDGVVWSDAHVVTEQTAWASGEERTYTL